MDEKWLKPLQLLKKEWNLFWRIKTKIAEDYIMYNLQTELLTNKYHCAVLYLSCPGPELSQTRAILDLNCPTENFSEQILPIGTSTQWSSSAYTCSHKLLFPHPKTFVIWPSSSFNQFAYFNAGKDIEYILFKGYITRNHFLEAKQ